MSLSSRSGTLDRDGSILWVTQKDAQTPKTCCRARAVLLV